MLSSKAILSFSLLAGAVIAQNATSVPASTPPSESMTGAVPTGTGSGAIPSGTMTGAVPTGSASPGGGPGGGGGFGGGGGGGPGGGVSGANEVSTCTAEHPCVEWPAVLVDGAWKNDAIIKAKALVAQMTTDEKVSIISSQGNTLTRLNYTGWTLLDGAHGLAGSMGVSAFVSSLSIAATFDRDLIYQHAKAMATEFRQKGYSAGGPNFNLYRTPTSGRSKESFGADPYVCGEASYEVSDAFRSAGAIVVGKHYIGNDQETNRQTVSNVIDSRTIHEVYLAPFARAVEGGMNGVMCAMNMVNGSWSCSNAAMINGELKGRLGFQGFVTPDVNGQKSVTTAGLNGLDIGSWTSLDTLVSNGTFPSARLDDMAERVVGAWYATAQDTDPAPTVSSAKTTNVQGDHAKIIRKAGAASIVVLKNNGALPLKAPTGIAVIGKDAGPTSGGPNQLSGTFLSTNFSSDGHLAGAGAGMPTFPWLVTPLEAIQARAHDNNTAVTWALNNSDTSAQQNAINGRISFGVVAYTIGPIDTCIAFADVNAGEGFDRTTWELNEPDNDMILNVANNCANTIVVLNTVGSVNIEQWADHENVTAIVWSGLLGQESGYALTDVLYGDVNPSGRLPFTWAKKESDYPAVVSDNSTITYSEGLFIDYRHFDQANIEPRYAFGYGQSYTNFTYSNAQVSTNSSSSSTRRSSSRIFGRASNATSSSLLPTTTASSPSAIPTSVNSTSPVGGSNSSDYTYAAPSPQSGLGVTAYTLTFTLTNSGPLKGCEVSQLYLSFPTSSSEPPHVLRGFERTCLDAGASAEVKLTLKEKDVRIWSVEKDEFIRPDGTISFSIGTSSRDLKLNGNLA